MWGSSHMPYHDRVVIFALVDDVNAAVVLVHNVPVSSPPPCRASECEKSALGKFNKCGRNAYGHAHGRARASWTDRRCGGQCDPFGVHVAVAAVVVAAAVAVAAARSPV